MNQSLISSLKGQDQLSITMVCLGNICRSPMAAAVLAGKTADWKAPRIEVHSSGTGAWHIGQGPHPSSKKIWEAAKKKDPNFTSSKMFWWYNMYSSADFTATPRPMYPADGRKVFDIHTQPMEMREDIKADLGDFPFPSFSRPKWPGPIRT